MLKHILITVVVVLLGDCVGLNWRPAVAPISPPAADSTNISPGPQTGIGNWSEAAFARAMREGVARDGSHLLPAFPYTPFTKLTSDDVKALYALFMTRPAVVATDRVNTIKFPFNVRALQAGWKLLFFDRGVYKNVAGKGEP